MAGKLGAKLRRTRESLGLTQEDLAKAVGLSSEFISMLEIGKRTPSLESLRRISGFLKKEIGYFVQEPEEDFQTLRRDKKLNREALAVIRRFERYCEDYLKLENLTSRPSEPAPLYQNVTAPSLAREERNRLGLGDEPIRDLFALLEISGLKLQRLPIPEKAKLAGLFIHFEAEQAGFALIDGSQSLGDQLIIAAHEYAHYLKDRNAGPILDNPDIFIEEYLPLYHPREKFAQTFALQFLVPPEKLNHLIQKEIHSRTLHFEDVIFLKRYFGVKTSTMLLILHRRELLPPHRYHEYSAVDSTSFERSLFGDVSGEEKVPRGKARPIASDRYKILGVSAYQKISRKKT
jgi:transcriptional regulator with XRE-family HTH domain